MLNKRPVPRATYRLQLTENFTFANAGDLAPYLASLGISHAYLSPVLKARRGSTHGYDAVDHTTLNPELGTRAEFETMAARLKACGIGIILDIVPNHMGIGGDQNDLWLDVLQWGRDSRYADWFDINWTSDEPSLHNKVLVPFLGSSFGDALDAGKFELRHDPATESFAIWAETAHKLPICPDTYHLIGDTANVAKLNAPEARGDLAELIEAQHWRPARYSVAADDINYRRFFIVSDLAAIRIERDEVFDHVHKLTFELVEQGLVDGLRVDHIDGLFDPKAYCLKLREKCPRPIYLVVEKILAPHERLRADWDVEGTTGYEFSSVMTRLLADPRGTEKLTAAYTDFVGPSKPFETIERDAKRSIIDFEMAAELDALTSRLRKLAIASPATADLTRNGLRCALREIVAAMPVYRTYVDGTEVADSESRDIALALAVAQQAAPALDPALFAFIGAVMTASLATDDVALAAEVTETAQRIQQYTGPVMAKGLEDSALYQYNRLLALNDVGSRPDRFSGSVAAFHDFNAARLQHSPHGMLTSSSHDTKRGEDTRARIVALTGCADEWAEATKDWYQLLRDAGAPEVDRDDVYVFFQLLLGAWPTAMAGQGAIDPAALETYRERLDGAMLKSIREARINTNWGVSQQDYEAKIAELVALALRPASPFLTAFRTFLPRIGTAGAQNGLIETVLKLTVPGVPDIYQGAEFWEQSLVDPDNRRPVDFAARQRAQQSNSTPIADLIDSWPDGRIKQSIIAKVLDLRRRMPDLFAHGSYEPVDTGSDTSVCAFLRRWENNAMVVAVRLYPWRAPAWGPEKLVLPEAISAGNWENLLEPEQSVAAPSLSRMLAKLPVFVTIRR